MIPFNPFAFHRQVTLVCAPSHMGITGNDVRVMVWYFSIGDGMPNTLSIDEILLENHQIEK